MDVRNRYSREKWCGMRIDKTCYIFAILNVIFVFLSALACVSTEAFLVTRVICSSIQNTISLIFIPSLIAIFPIYTVGCVLTVVCGIFAVLLLQGIRLKEPKLVKAYLCFGLIVEIVMIAATVISLTFIIFIRIPSQNYVFICGGIAVAMVICTVYGYILCLVRYTYHMMLLRKNNDIGNGQLMLYICDEYLSTPER